MPRRMTEEQLANLIPQTIPGPEMVETPEDYDGPIEYVNWGGYKIAVYGAAALTTELFDRIKQRLNENRSVIIIVTGMPGDGKSWQTLSFADMFDPDFAILDTDNEVYFKENTHADNYIRKKERQGYICEKVKHEQGGYIVQVKTPPENQDPSQTVFDREHFLHLIGNETPLKRGATIMADEAQYAMGVRRWYEDLQKDLMESIESVRSRGFIILIVALHLELVDKVIRKFVLTYMFHVEDRGRAVVYRLHTPRFESDLQKYRLGELILPMPHYDACINSNCLNCEYLYGDNPQRIRCHTKTALYERRKNHFVGMRSKQSQEKAAAEKANIQNYTDSQLSTLVYNNKDRITYTRGRINPASLKIIIRDEIGIELGRNKCRDLRNFVELDHTDIAKDPET